jgi:hypothetical protein
MHYQKLTSDWKKALFVAIACPANAKDDKLFYEKGFALISSQWFLN